MENRKNKVLVIAFISILTLTTGCGITITKNHYYTYPEQRIKKSNIIESQNEHSADTLINNKNGQN